MKKIFIPKYKLGFTLAEVMLTIILLSSISAIAIPVIAASRPSTEKVLLKKAYNTTENVIGELAGNGRFYPQEVTLQDINSSKYPNNNSPSGFLNNSYPPNDANLEMSIQNISEANKVKGCNCYDVNQNKLSVLFCCSLKTVNKKGNTICTTASNKTTCNFETIDGITWHTEDFTRTETDLTKPVFTITVDVDNRWGGRHKTITDSGYKKTRFVFMVYYDGKISADADAQNILADAMSNKRLNY